MPTNESPNQALLKNPELVEGAFRPVERAQGPEFIEGQRIVAMFPPQPAVTASGFWARCIRAGGAPGRQV